MTQNWTDNPLTTAVYRKKTHITELMNALEERLRLMNNDSHHTSGDYEVPIFAYDITIGAIKEWGDDYPKADPAHWPPNESPDNEFTNDIIYGCRGFLFGDRSSAQSGGHADEHSAMHNMSTFDGTNFYKQFLDGDTGKYLCWTSVDNVLTAAISKTTFVDPTLTANLVYIKKQHINEIRNVWEQLCVLPTVFTVYESRDKSGFSSSESSANNAWSAVKTDLAGNSWSAWTTASTDSQKSLYGSARITLDVGGTQYSARITITEIRLTFDLDLEISSMGWNVLPPVSAKIVTYGLDTDYDNENLFVKCVTTGETNTVGNQDADGRAYLLDSDVKSKFGNGHGAEEFIFSSLNEWSSADQDLLRPDSDPTAGNTESKYVQISPLQYGSQYAKHMAFIVFEPDWHLGRA